MKDIFDKDWVGNHASSFATLGASSHSVSERAELDYYATDPRAVEMLLQLETFNNNIWECACGEGHISNVLTDAGYRVRNTDIVDRGLFGASVLDFLHSNEKWDGDIVTNPPYKEATQFVYKALDSISQGNKIAMFLKIQFLETQGRAKLFEEHPPKVVYISRSRIMCARNGNFDTKESSAVCYCWYIWEKGYQGYPTIKWFN